LPHILRFVPPLIFFFSPPFFSGSCSVVWSFFSFPFHPNRTVRGQRPSSGPFFFFRSIIFFPSSIFLFLSDNPKKDASLSPLPLDFFFRAAVLPIYTPSPSSLSFPCHSVVTPLPPLFSVSSNKPSLYFAPFSPLRNSLVACS